MIVGLLLIYILKLAGAPIWCFVLAWVHIVLCALKIIIGIGGRNGRKDS